MKSDSGIRINLRWDPDARHPVSPTPGTRSTLHRWLGRWARSPEGFVSADINRNDFCDDLELFASRFRDGKLGDYVAAWAGEEPTSIEDDLDTPASRLAMVRAALQGIVDGLDPIPLARAGIDFCDLTEAERATMRGDG